MWNDATDNRDKSVVTISRDAFFQNKDTLDSSGINYFAFATGEQIKMAVNNSLMIHPNSVPQDLKLQLWCVP